MAPHVKGKEQSTLTVIRRPFHVKGIFTMGWDSALEICLVSHP